MTGAAHVEPHEEAALLQSITDRRTPRSWLNWSPSQKVAAFRNFDQLFAARRVGRGQHVAPMPSGDRDLSDVRYRVWNFQGGVVLVPLFKQFDIDDYILHNNVAGLLVIKSGEIVLERYMAGNTPQSRWVSMSATKSVVSMLVGAAIADSAIRSVEDLVTDYLPSLRGSAYEHATIESLLQMSSGVRWNEDYVDPQSDVNTTQNGMVELIAFVGVKPRVADPGATFNYNSAESVLLGAIVEAAVDEELASYLERKIWRPFGMESDANWMTYQDGRPIGGCCISATLRDYGRLGLFAMSQSTPAGGQHVLAEDWMALSTMPSSSYDGYGYQWWLREDGSYSAMGLLGQLIHVNPAEDLVIVTHSSWDRSDSNNYNLHQSAFISAVTAALKL